MERTKEQGGMNTRRKRKIIKSYPKKIAKGENCMDGWKHEEVD